MDDAVYGNMAQSAKYFASSHLLFDISEKSEMVGLKEAIKLY
jgi:hypothetical protein